MIRIANAEQLNGRAPIDGHHVSVIFPDGREELAIYVTQHGDRQIEERLGQDDGTVVIYLDQQADK